MTSQALGETPGRRWASAHPVPWPGHVGVVREQQWIAPDIRRQLQLALAGLWLLDAVLQFQAAMFTTGFAHMLAATAPGNPPVIAGPITWAARIIGDHVTAANAIFAHSASAGPRNRLAADRSRRIGRDSRMGHGRLVVR